MQRHSNNNSRGEKGPSFRGSRRRSLSDEGPSRLSSQQQPLEAATGDSIPITTMNRSKSYGSGSCSSDVKPTKTKQTSNRDRFNSPSGAGAAASDYYIEAFRRLSTLNRKSPCVAYDANSRSQRQPHTGGGASESSSSPRRHYKKKCYSNPTPPPPTSSRSSEHTAVKKSSHFPRRNVYSQGVIDVQKFPPPRRQRAHEARIPKAPIEETTSTSTPPSALGESSLREVSHNMAVVPSRRNSPQRSNTPVRSLEEIKGLCMEIIQSTKEGRSSPPRSEIKEVVAESEYHQSRNHAVNPRDPDFVGIPSEHSEVLTHGLARSQPVQQMTAATGKESHVKAPKPRSKFSEIKDEGECDEASPLHSTIVLGPNEEDEVSCVSLPSIVDHSRRYS